MLSAAGGCELSTTTHVKTAWKKFKELLQFFLHATPLSRHMCTALVCGAQRSNGAVKTAFHIQDEGKHGPGRPKMTWKQLTERDCRERKLSAINPHDRNMWRYAVGSAVHAASQLSGRGPTVVGVAPVPAC